MRVVLDRIAVEFPDAELVFTAKAVGSEDAAWLLAYATSEQLVTVFDLDAWRGPKLDLASVDRWVATLAEAVMAEGKTRVVLAGMGGSSLGPEVICATYDKPLITLDSTDPDQVRDALSGDLESTILVVSSKSGGTVETDSQRRAFEDAFEQSGLDPRQHIVIVTDPGSPLHKAAVDAGYRAIFDFSGSLADRYCISNLPVIWCLLSVVSGTTHRPATAQMRYQLFLQGPAWPG